MKPGEQRTQQLVCRVCTECAGGELWREHSPGADRRAAMLFCFQTNKYMLQLVTNTFILVRSEEMKY